jgi:hypothetical protein
LRHAVELDRDNARFSYVYAVAIGEKDPKEAIRVLEKAYEKHTGDLQIISGLVYCTKMIGETAKSRIFEESLEK